MTVTTPTNWYCNYGNGSTTGYFAVTKWATGTAKTVGNIVRQTAPATASERCFICIVAGTTNATTEPTWVTTKGAKTTDNTVTWMECSGNPALNADNGSTPLSSQNRSGSQVLGNIIQNNAGTFYFICTTAGTTGAGEPTYNTTTGATTVDSGCTWTCIGAVSSFTTAWLAPHARIGNLNGWVPANTGVIYVSSAHAETQAAALAISIGGAAGSNSPVNVVCVANAGSFPPVAANITTGATVTTTGNFGITITGTAEYNGIAFSSGSGANAPTFTIGSNTSASFIRIRNGSLATPTSGISLRPFLGCVELYNTTMAFGSSTGQSCTFSGSTFVWRDTPSAVSATTWPTTLFQNASSQGCGSMIIEDVDLSGFSGSQIFATNPQSIRAVFNRCKLPSVVVGSGGHLISLNAGIIDLVNCDTGGATYDSQRIGWYATQSISTTAYVASGASDGTTNYSWNIATSTNLVWSAPFECPCLSIWNSTTGANRTVTLLGAYVGTALPTNDQIWFDVVYFGTASSTLGTRAVGTKATFLTANSTWSADSSTDWTQGGSARQNSHSYVLGDAITVSSSGGVNRLFICTTLGSSAGSLPGAYATATDGTQVTDGTAVFTAVERFSMALTLSAPQPQEAGYFEVYVRCAAPSATFFINPVPALS